MPRQLPRLTSRATVATGQVQRFRSRPDLAPAAVRIDLHRPGQAQRLIFLDSHIGPGDQGPMVIDGSGELVWFRPVSDNRRSANRAFNVKVQQWQGRRALTWFDGDVVAAHGRGEYVIMGSAYNTVARVRAGNGYSDDLHAFLLTPAGTAFVSAYGTAYADLSPYGGKSYAPYVYGVAQELDVATGEVLFEWRSDQHVAFEESYAPMEDKQPWDYFHINSIAIARDGNLLVSARNTWTVYKIDRATGAVLWRLGGKKTDFKFGRGAHFSWQHDVNELPDGTVTVFDNGAGDYVTERQSRGLFLTIDDRARRVTLSKQYLHPRAPIVAAALGSVQVTADGHVFIGWGAEAAFTEFGPDGTVLLDGRLAGQTVQSYRAYRQAWVGFPTEPPALVAQSSGQQTTLYVSWNGATQVTDWLVLLGDRPSALSPVGTAPRAGFESVLSVPRRGRYAAVAGLDGRGRELGRSQPVATWRP